MSWLRTIILSVAILLIVVVYQRHDSATTTRQVAELQRERDQLIDYIRRLSASRRVGQVRILDQRRGEHGQTETTILWQEFDEDGLAGQPRELTVIGEQIYVEAMIVKFDHDFIVRGDVQRGESMVLFRRVFGEAQAPQSGADLPGAEPHRRISAADDEPMSASAFWKRFWELVDSPSLARRYGVRVAQCEAPAVRVRAGDLWEVTLDAAGGLNLRKISDSEERASYYLPQPYSN